MYKVGRLLSVFLKQLDLLRKEYSSAFRQSLRCESKHLRKYNQRHIEINWSFRTCCWICSYDKERRQHLYDFHILDWPCSCWANLHLFAKFLRLFWCFCNPANFAFFQYNFDQLHNLKARMACVNIRTKFNHSK